MIEPATAGNSEVATNDVEDIFIDTGAGADVVVISGNLGGTGLATSTITIEGGSDDANDIVDARGLTSDHGIVVNGGGGDDYLFVGAGGGRSPSPAARHDTIDFGLSAAVAGGVNVDLRSPCAEHQ